MRGTCLVVDDSRVIRKMARRIMESLGFSVEEAGDGREALDACLTAAPDLVLLDWNMPVMDGLEFLRALHASAIRQKPKVVFCTTENGIGHIRTAMEAGADEYVMKPFDRAAVAEKLAALGID